MKWVSIQLKGTGNWRIASVGNGWSEGDYTNAPKAGEIFPTKTEADSERDERNNPPSTDQDLN